MATSAVQCITLYPLAIPLRKKVTHAASQREVADPIVVAVELNSGATGYGETLPREYVTGETVASVSDMVERVYAADLVELHPRNFPEALEAIDGLTWRHPCGSLMPAARAAVELALLDAYSRHFDRPIAEAAGWMGISGFGFPGSLRRVRFSGVLAGAGSKNTKRLLRMAWWYGLRDFKLKVGDTGDEQRLRETARYLARATKSGRATLRVDVNGAWDVSQAIQRLTAWSDVGLAAVEQPLAKGDEKNLPELKSCVHAPLMFDESLVTMDDAVSLVTQQVADAFNIRISKCGGLLPSLRLAEFARRHGVMIQLGCMVGETSILSAAGLRFLEIVPRVHFAEGCFGSFLLADDVVRQPLRFGYGGRFQPLPAGGWGVDVNVAKLEEYTADRPLRLRL